MPLPGQFDDWKKKLTDDPGNNVPIVISAVSVSGIGGGAATVAWTTDKASSSRVEYGVSPNRFQKTTTEADTSVLVTSHSVALSGLVVGSLYLFRVHSRYGGGKDGGNNVVMDGYDFFADGSFTA